MQIDRRRFLGNSAKAVLVAGTLAHGKVFGANDRIGIGVIGLNGRGGKFIDEYAGKGKTRVVALCDVDAHVLERRVKETDRKQRGNPKPYRDIRALLADEDVDAVCIATPNHWHTLAAIWACAAGKDVYVEKPLSHEVWEGRQLVAAAQRYNRIVQHGTQRRSESDWLRDIEALHNGVIGDVFKARAVCYKTGNRKSIGFAAPATPPEYLDWGRWQGPAQERDYCANYVHYNWHWFWDYGNGEIGNQGVHQMDVATWGLAKGLPVRVYSAGGRYAWNDQGETPNTQTATFTYADGATLDFEVRNLGSYEEAGVTVGNMFFGTEGYFVEGKGFYDLKHRRIKVKKKGRFPDCFERFIDAVRTRDTDAVPANALDGHIASAHCHLANISYRLGRSLDFDPKTESFIGDDEANAMTRRVYRPGFEVPQLA